MLKDLVPEWRQERRRWPGGGAASPPPPTPTPLLPLPQVRTGWEPSLGPRRQQSRARVPRAVWLLGPQKPVLRSQLRGPPFCRSYLRGVGPPPGGPWEFMMALGPALGTLMNVSAQRTDCPAPNHYLGPASHPTFARGSLARPAWVESPFGPVSASAKPSDPWTESPEPLGLCGLGTLDATTQPVPTPPPPTNPETDTRADTLVASPGAQLWQSAA